MSNDSRVKDAKEEIDDDFVSKGASNITEDDFRKVTNKADEIREKFEEGGPLGKFVNDVKLLTSIVQDYYKGNYREVPYISACAIVFTLLYVLNPMDLVPNFIPVIGSVDDATVVGVCLVMVEQDLHEYKEWKVKQAEGQLKSE